MMEKNFSEVAEATYRRRADRFMHNVNQITLELDKYKNHWEKFSELETQAIQNNERCLAAIANGLKRKSANVYYSLLDLRTDYFTKLDSYEDKLYTLMMRKNLITIKPAPRRPWWRRIKIALWMTILSTLISCGFSMYLLCNSELTYGLIAVVVFVFNLLLFRYIEKKINPIPNFRI